VTDKLVRLKDLTNNLIPIKLAEFKRVQKELTTLQKEEHSLKEYFRRTPQVSDHAIVRHIERVKNINIEDLKKEILTPEREEYMRMGATTINCDGVDFVIAQDGTVVTCIK
jgi:hypothetical protein